MRTTSRKVNKRILDIKSNKVIDLLHMDVFGSNEMVFIINQDSFPHFNEWMNEIMMKIREMKSSSYKRDIYIQHIGEKSIKLGNCFITSFHFEDGNKMQVNLKYDWVDTGDFPELKSIIRDLLISEILIK